MVMNFGLRPVHAMATVLAVVASVVASVVTAAALLVPGAAAADRKDLTPGLSGRGAAETVVLALPAGCRSDVVCVVELRRV